MTPVARPSVAARTLAVAPVHAPVRAPVRALPGLTLAGLLLATAPAPAATLYTFEFDGFRHISDLNTDTVSGTAVFRIDEAAVDAAAASGGFVTVSPFTTWLPQAWQDAIQLVSVAMRVESAAGTLLRSFSHDGTGPAEVNWWTQDGNLWQIRADLWELDAASRVVGGFQLGFSSERAMNLQRRTVFHDTGEEDLRDGVAPDGVFSNVFGATGCIGSYAAFHDASVVNNVAYHCRHDNGTFDSDTRTWSVDPFSSVTLTSQPANGGDDGGSGNGTPPASVVPLPATGWLLLGSLSGLGLLARRRRSV